MKFPMLATNWEVFGSDSARSGPAASLFCSLGDVGYDAEIRDIEKNSSQITHHAMDARIGDRIESLGGSLLKPPNRETKDCDLFFNYNEVNVIVEVERANHEKFLRDLLKIHRYLHHGADIGVLMVPRSFAHSGGSSGHLETAQSHVKSCQEYGFWNREMTDRFLLVSFDLFDGSGRPYSPELRSDFQERARGG